MRTHQPKQQSKQIIFPKSAVQRFLSNEVSFCNSWSKWYMDDSLYSTVNCLASMDDNSDHYSSLRGEKNKYFYSVGMGFDAIENEEMLLFYKQSVDDGGLLVYTAYKKQKREENDDYIDFSPFDCSLSNDEKNIFVATSNRIISISTVDGEVLWIKRLCAKSVCSSNDEFEANIRDIEFDINVENTLVIGGDHLYFLDINGNYLREPMRQEKGIWSLLIQNELNQSKRLFQAGNGDLIIYDFSNVHDIKVIWSFRYPKPQRPPAFVKPYENIILLATFNNDDIYDSFYLTSIRLNDGQMMWTTYVSDINTRSFELCGMPKMQISSSDNSVMFIYSKDPSWKIIKFDIQTGKQIKSKSLQKSSGNIGCVRSILDARYILIAGGSKVKIVRTIDLATVVDMNIIDPPLYAEITSSGLCILNLPSRDWKSNINVIISASLSRRGTINSYWASFQVSQTKEYDHLNPLEILSSSSK